MARRSSSSRRSEVRKFLEDVSVWIDGCWHWIGDINRDSIGYGCFYHNGKRQLAHRYMWELINDQKVPAGKIIRHSCDNSICVNPQHLQLGTQKDNIQDMIDRDRQIHAKGFENKGSRVTKELMATCFKLKRNGRSTSEIASELRLGVSTVGHILTPKSRYEKWYRPEEAEALKIEIGE